MAPAANASAGPACFMFIFDIFMITFVLLERVMLYFASSNLVASYFDDLINYGSRFR